MALGGLDLLVFTGGIGAHAAPIRAEACAGLEAIGLHLDMLENRRGAGRISAPDSRCAVRVIVADEESTMAREGAEGMCSIIASSKGKIVVSGFFQSVLIQTCFDEP